MNCRRYIWDCIIDKLEGNNTPPYTRKARNENATAIEREFFFGKYF